MTLSDCIETYGLKVKVVRGPGHDGASTVLVGLEAFLISCLVMLTSAALNY